MMQKLTEFKGETGNSAIIVTDFIPHSQYLIGQLDIKLAMIFDSEAMKT